MEGKSLEWRCNEPEKRALQKEAVAHIAVQKMIDERKAPALPFFPGSTFTHVKELKEYSGLINKKTREQKRPDVTYI